jgi:hypothetical protein
MLGVMTEGVADRAIEALESARDLRAGFRVAIPLFL